MRNRERWEAIAQQQCIQEACNKAAEGRSGCDAYKATSLFSSKVGRNILIGALTLGILITSTGCSKDEDAKPANGTIGESGIVAETDKAPSEEIGLGGLVGEKEETSAADVLIYKAPEAVKERQKEFIKQNVDEMHLIAYNRLGQLNFTEHYLPSGHKIYKDDADQGWIFSGRTLIKVKLDGLDLESSKCPIYGDQWMDYVDLPAFAVLRTEEGFDITRNGISPVDITDPSATFTSVMLNGTPVEVQTLSEDEVLATTDSIKLSVFGVNSLEDAKVLYDSTDVTTTIDGKEYKILNANTYSHHWCVLLYDGDKTFGIQLASMDNPLNYEDNMGSVYVRDNVRYIDMLKEAYGKDFKGDFKVLMAEVDGKQMVFDPTTKSVEEVTAIKTAEDGSLTVSSAVLKDLFGLRMMMDGDTLCMQTGSNANELGVELGYVQDNLCNDGILQFSGCGEGTQAADIANTGWKAIVMAEELKAKEAAEAAAKAEAEKKAAEEAAAKAEAEKKAAEEAAKKEQEAQQSQASKPDSSQSQTSTPESKPAESKPDTSTSTSSGGYTLNEYGNPVDEMAVRKGLVDTINVSDPRFSKVCAPLGYHGSTPIPNPFAKVDPISPFKGMSNPPADWPNPTPNMPEPSGEYKWDSETGCWRYYNDGRASKYYLSLYGGKTVRSSEVKSMDGSDTYNSYSASTRGVY